MAFGGVIKLTGESDYKRALQEINRQLAEATSHMKATTSAFDKNASSVLATKTKTDELNKVYDVQDAKLKLMGDEYGRLTRVMDNLTKEREQLQASYDVELEKMTKLRAELGADSEEYKKQVRVWYDVKVALDENAQSIENNRVAMSDMRIAMNNTTTDLNKTGNEFNKLAGATEDSGKKAEKASKGFTVFKGVIANLAAEGISAAIKGIVSLGKSLIKLGQDSIMGFAEFEQSMGGVEAIFGEEAAKTVANNARVAYTTAGLSATEYMEKITGFSSTLIKSLKGDTQEAARLSDVAIRDMADNANKLGTDTKQLQTAYDNFAKGQFKTLSNLNLGYEGSKKGMEQLLKEAQKLSGQKFNIKNYSDIIEAIHVIQEDMGITGSTAEEASKTIQGSLGAMKSAWQNLLTGLSDDNANIFDLVDNLVNSLITPDGEGGVIGTILPRISTLLERLASAAVILIPKILNDVAPAIVNALPNLLTAFQTLVTTLTRILPSLVEPLGQLVTSVLETLIQAAPDLLMSVVGMVQELAPEIGRMIPELVGVILQMTPDLIQAGSDILIALLQGLTEGLPIIIEMLPELLTNIVTVLTDNLPLIMEAGYTLLQAVFEGILQALPELLTNLPTIITSMVDMFLTLLPMMVDAGVSLLTALVDNLPAIIDGLCAALPELITGLVLGILTHLDEIALAGVSLLVNLVARLPEALITILGAIPKIITGMVGAFKAKWPEIKKAGKDLIEGLWNGINDKLTWLKEKLSGFARSALDAIKNFFGINSPSRVFRDEIGKSLAEGIGVGFTDEMQNVTEQMQNAIPTRFDVSPEIQAANGGVQVNMNVYGANGQSEERLANRIMEKINVSLQDQRRWAY